MMLHNHKGKKKYKNLHRKLETEKKPGSDQEDKSDKPGM